MISIRGGAGVGVGRWFDDRRASGRRWYTNFILVKYVDRWCGVEE